MARQFLSMSSKGQLTTSVRRVRGAWASMGPELEKANQEAVSWLNARALSYLNAEVAAHGRPQRESARMVNVLESGETSAYTRYGFRFGAAEKLNHSSVGMYWRGIEYGSDVFVGRTMRAIWITRGGGVVPPMQGPANVDPRMPNDWHGAFRSSRGGWRVEIRHPIPPYRFMQRAAVDFGSEGIYTILLAQASRQWRDVLATAAATGLSPKRVRSKG